MHIRYPETTQSMLTNQPSHSVHDLVTSQLNRPQRQLSRLFLLLPTLVEHGERGSGQRERDSEEESKEDVLGRVPGWPLYPGSG